MMKKIILNSKRYGKRWVVGDVHGCLKTLKKLVEERIELQKEDILFLLGDYIDRGPNSGGVIEYIFMLRKQGFIVYTLRGNHEEYILDALAEYDEKTFKFFVERLNKSKGLLNDQGKLPDVYKEFFESLPYHIELDVCHLVHAGFGIKKENPLENYQAMISVRYNNDCSEAYKKIVGEKFVVHGHQPTSIHKIKQAVEQRKTIIPLDNGCVYFGRKHKQLPIDELGNLCALNVDSFELIIQPNVE